MIKEEMLWLDEVRKIFPKLSNKIIFAEYKRMIKRKLGYVKTKIEQELKFDTENLILGKNMRVIKKRIMPKEFFIYVNEKIKNIKNPEIKKEVFVYILIHELLHIEMNDLISLSKSFNRRKKKKIHVNAFEKEVFQRYNQFRVIEGIKKINKKEHIDSAMNKILKSVEII